MRFIIEVDLDAVTGEPAAELGRILRYWGGNTKHLDLAAPTSMAVTDTEYKEVGELRIVDAVDQ
jgi:hypothetical protein